MRATAFNQQVAQSLGISVKNVFRDGVGDLGHRLGGRRRGGRGRQRRVVGPVGLWHQGVSGGDPRRGSTPSAAAVIGGIIIGLLENIAQYVDSEYLHWGNLYEVAPFYVLIIILMIKPYGLFRHQRHRAGVS